MQLKQLWMTVASMQNDYFYILTVLLAIHFRTFS